MNLDDALKEAKKWNYSNEGKIGVGIFYRRIDRTFEQRNIEWKLARKTIKTL
jgi:hypothetical protein